MGYVTCFAAAWKKRIPRHSCTQMLTNLHFEKTSVRSVKKNIYILISPEQVDEHHRLLSPVDVLQSINDRTIIYRELINTCK